MHRAVALVLLVLVAGCVSPAAREPAAGPLATPERAPLVALPAGAVSGGAEPMILAARDGALYVGDTSGLARSRDGGATWERVPIPFLEGFFTDGRALAEDDAGTLYVATTNGQLISLAASEDGGDTWRVNHVVDASGIADRPWVAARGDGEVAVIYYDTKTTREACLHSTDGGRTFLVRYAGIVATPNAGNAAFGPEGELYYSVSNVAYRWDVPCLGEPARLVHGATQGATVFTQLAVSAAGDLFVAGPSADNGEMRLYARPATGGPWRGLALSPPDARSNTFAAISERNGEVAVAWYASDAAGNPASASFEGSWHVHLARVTDVFGARIVQHQVLTSEPNHVGDLCMAGVSCTSGDRDLLDYFGVDHGPDGAIHVAYGHDGAGRDAEVRYAYVAP